MKASFSSEFDMGRRYLRGHFDFAAIDDRARMPWRFLARHMAVDGDLARP